MDRWLEKFAHASFRRSADTAHDLKTPLNVAVLNLELLRMRLAKLGDAPLDQKVASYTAAVELELRRLARIFDAFFILSTPPKDEDAPAMIDLAALAVDVAKNEGYTLNVTAGIAKVRAHESRMRQALKMFFDGASKLLPDANREAHATFADDRYAIAMSGTLPGEDFDLSKIFKLYYSDQAGSPDLSLAAARLIAETYGGELSAVQDRDKVMLSFSVPLGDE